ncbi:hypothetical protein [Ureaplasma zalophigenitalium]|uniref:Uncharacterized protein n=1 Tax=Ureaplasma zalophigenitalium TaxID=907723 RepID=A0ABT3BPY8_9BACT|nr:hypothetical protein [Ureaplasma zalophigenitalium]MCV3754328.1 hypothetical protein [Ureaplasma zalophigenitalium]
MHINWIKIYYDLIDLWKTRGHLTGPFKSLKCSDYQKNYRLPNGQWKYQRHHIDEINISGLVLKVRFPDEYKNSEAIIITFEQHLLLHYIIVNARTTYPNNGMLKQTGVDEWDAIVQLECTEHQVPYFSGWYNHFSTIEGRKKQKQYINDCMIPRLKKN